MILPNFTYFFLTLLIELPIAWLFFRNQPKKRFLLYVFLVNLFTWPLANFANAIYQNFFLIEAGVFLAETVLMMLLFETKLSKAALVSFCANFASAFIGVLIFKFF